MSQLSVEQKKLIKIYGRSAKGNFGVIDTIGVPHPYMVGTKHVVHASDHHMGMLGKETMEVIPCEICHKTFTDGKHETALLLECLKEPKNHTAVGKEAEVYLKKIIKFKHFKKNKFVGVTLLDSFSKK